MCKNSGNISNVAFIAVAVSGKKKYNFFRRVLSFAGAYLCIASALFSEKAFADVPLAYYSMLDGKTGAELKSACHLTVKNLTRVSSYSALPKYFAVTDVYPDTDIWWDMYSDLIFYTSTFSGLNREHSFPKSWWGGGENVNAYTDLNHLYPAEMDANMAKSNYPLGIVDRTSRIKFDNGVSTVGYPVSGQGGGATYVYEPDDEYKGDFARAYFYMVTCYQDYEWNTRYMYMLQQDEYPTLKPWAVDMLLEWSREDPVSQKEIDRNEVVFGFQNNRNPFIDFPSLAEYIWGEKVGTAFYIDGATGEPTLSTPTETTNFDLGQIAIGRSVTSAMHFLGCGLTSDIAVSTYTAEKEMFSSAAQVIPAYLVNSPEGYWLNITYTPTRLGEHHTLLHISSSDDSVSRDIELLGECLEQPVLNVCRADAPSDITYDSYTANWTAPADDEIDFFVVTRTMYSNGTAREEKLKAWDNYLVIDGFGNSDKESYFVRSSRLGYLSDPSNVVFVSHDGVTGVEIDQPISVIATENGVRVVCSAPQTGLVVFDAMGRVVKTIAKIQNNDDITLPLGVYFIVTDQSQQPLKIAVR